MRHIPLIAVALLALGCNNQDDGGVVQTDPPTVDLNEGDGLPFEATGDAMSTTPTNGVYRLTVCRGNQGFGDFFETSSSCISTEQIVSFTYDENAGTGIATGTDAFTIDATTHGTLAANVVEGVPADTEVVLDGTADTFDTITFTIVGAGPTLDVLVE